MEVVEVVDRIVNYPPSPNRRLAWDTRDITDIEWLLVHHTAGPEDAAPQDVHAAQQWRNFGRADRPVYAPRITYHYLISPEGVIYKTNWARSITWHCPGKNSRGMSFCLIGNRSLLPAPEPQWWSLVKLLRAAVRAYNRALERIGLHRTFFPTQCPGTLIDLSKLRADVAR